MHVRPLSGLSLDVTRRSSTALEVTASFSVDVTGLLRQSSKSYLPSIFRFWTRVRLFRLSVGAIPFGQLHLGDSLVGLWSRLRTSFLSLGAY